MMIGCPIKIAAWRAVGSANKRHNIILNHSALKVQRFYK